METPGERPTDAEIVEGPTPEATGYVVFKVRVGEHVYRGLACAIGGGADVKDGDLETVGKVMRAVHRFMEAHSGEMLGLYREAARLRRIAGNPPMVGASTLRHVSVVGEPRSVGGSAIFRTKGAPTELQVFICEGGGLMDDCEDPTIVSDADRDAAITAVLDHIFAHREQAAALGIDVGLLEELYR